MKRLLEKLFVALVVVAVVGMATSASAVQTVYSGSISNVTGVSGLDLTGNIVYAINVGGTAQTVGGVAFTRDDEAYQNGDINNIGNTPGTYQNPWQAGYYGAMLSTGTWNSATQTGDSALNALLNTGRNDSGDLRMSQFNVLTGHQYKVQVLAQDSNRNFDLSVGFVSGSNPIAGSTWAATNLAVDNLNQNGANRLWTSPTLTATDTRLLVNVGASGSFGTPGGGDQFGIINAYIVTDLGAVPEPSTLVLLAAGLVGLLAYAWRKRK